MYRVKTVVSMTGIPRNTLVAWERRYAIFETKRSENGYRVYTDEDVELLRRLKSHVDAGLAISEAVNLASHEGTWGPAPRRSLWRDMLDPLLAFDRGGADAFARRAELLPIDRAIDEVYRPMLIEVGLLWAAGRLNIAQEHFASAYVREAVLACFRRLDAGPADGPLVACAGVPGEQHDVGLLMLAVRLALRGWRVVWLGADLPIADLCVYLAQYPPRLVCLSAMVPHPELVDQARRVLSAARPETSIVVGGAGVQGLEESSTDRLWFCPDEDEFFRRLPGLRGLSEVGVH